MQTKLRPLIPFDRVSTGDVRTAMGPDTEGRCDKAYRPVKFRYVLSAGLKVYQYVQTLVQTLRSKLFGFINSKISRYLNP